MLSMFQCIKGKTLGTACKCVVLLTLRYTAISSAFYSNLRQEPHRLDLNTVYMLNFINITSMPYHWSSLSKAFNQYPQTSKKRFQHTFVEKCLQKNCTYLFFNSSSWILSQGPTKKKYILWILILLHLITLYIYSAATLDFTKKNWKWELRNLLPWPLWDPAES